MFCCVEQVTWNVYVNEKALHYMAHMLLTILKNVDGLKSWVNRLGKHSAQVVQASQRQNY